MSSFFVSWSHICTSLKPALLSPESFFVSDKPFHAVWVHVQHQGFLHPSQILGGVHLTFVRVTTTIWYIRVGCMKLRWWRYDEVQGEMRQWQSNSWGMWNMVLEESGWECHRITYFVARLRTGEVLERVPIAQSWSAWEIRQNDLWVSRWLPQWREWQHQRT